MRMVLFAWNLLDILRLRSTSIALPSLCLSFPHLTSCNIARPKANVILLP